MSLGTLIVLFIIWSILAFGAIYFVGKKLLEDYKLFKKGLLNDVHFIGDTLSRLKTEIITMVGNNTEEVERLKADIRKIRQEIETSHIGGACLEIESNKSYIVTLQNKPNENIEKEIEEIINYFKSNNSQVLILIDGDIKESKESIRNRS